MKICPKCGTFANDEAHFCNKCGAKLEEQFMSSNQQKPKATGKKEELKVISIISSLIGILSIFTVFSCFGVALSLSGVIISTIGLKYSTTKQNRNLAVIGLVICLFTSYFSLSINVQKIGSNSEPKEQAEETQVEETQVETPSPTIEPTEAPINYKEVFLYDLILNSTSYVNQYVETSFSIHYCYPKENDGLTEIASEYTDYDLTGEMDNIFVYLDGLVEYEMDQYITVHGKFVYKDSRYCIIDAEVTDIGSQSEKSFQDGLIIYTHYRNEQLQASKESFIASCVEVSYDDLLRYPETYQDVPIKLTIVASDVKADGWIFKGDILAEYQGGDLIVFDDREVREPRLVTGDKVTVYATGAGLGKMQIKQEGIILDKTVDEYNIPQISIKYTEWDKAFTEMDSSSKASDDGDLYDEGKRAGDNLAETLGEIDWDENKSDAREAGKEIAEYINEIIGAE